MKRISTQHSALFEQIVHSVVGTLRKQGVSGIKANCEGFIQPGKVQWDEKDDGVTPDILVEHDGAVHVFEIETRDDLRPEIVENRWRLLSVFARRKSGKFYLVIPEKKVEHLREVMRDIEVQPEILKLSGIA